MNSHEKVSLVGGGMIIEDENGKAAGFRVCKRINDTIMKHISPPPLAFATYV